jgi:hypothetical protein
VIFDTGCSYSITPFKSDFVSKIEPVANGTMSGIGNEIKIKGKGWVEWDLVDKHGVVARIRTQAYYIPEAKDVRLFSPQSYFQENKMRGRDCCWFDGYDVHFTTANDAELVFPFDAGNNIPYMLTTEYAPVAGLTAKQILNLSKNTDTELRNTCHQILCEANNNLTQAQKELHLWHQRLCHLGQAWIQELMKNTAASTGDRDDPVLPTKHRAAYCERTQCAACLMGKQHVRTPESTTTHVNKDMENAISKSVDRSDDTFSMDQIVCKLPGRLPNTFGKEKTNLKYNGATLYTHHKSQFLFLHNQVSLRAGETLIGKNRLCKIAAEFGIKVKHFHTDNHPFGSKEFMDDLELNEQTITFSGVGAHHQNGRSENAVKTVTAMARSMLMHQLIHWPDEFDPSLWPFAMEHAVYIWNHMPKTSSGLSPWELFTSLKDPNYTDLRRARVWGCPVYVLDPTLQDGQKLPKWKKRTRLGMNLGVSEHHSSNINRVLSLDTGHVSPQYHVVYDELFTTVVGDLTDRVFESEEWNSLFLINGEENLLDPRDVKHGTEPIPNFFDDFVEASDPTHTTRTSDSTVTGGRKAKHDHSVTFEPEPSVIKEDDKHQQDTWELEGILSHRVRRGRAEVLVEWTGEYKPTWEPVKNLREDVPEVLCDYAEANRLLDNKYWQWAKNWRKNNHNKDSAINPKQAQVQANKGVREHDQSNSTKSTVHNDKVLRAATFRGQPEKPRNSKQPYHRYAQFLAGGNEHKKVLAKTVADSRLNGMTWTTLLTKMRSPFGKKILACVLKEYDVENGTLEGWHPMALAARANEDIPNWHQATTGPDAAGFWEAMRKEIETLEKKGVWEVVKRENWMTVVPTTWAFRYKRTVFGTVKKLKARFCMRGDLEKEGINYWDSTYAPVISWNTVRLMTMLQAQLGLASHQVDYVCAFTNAEVEKPPGWDKMTPEEQYKNSQFAEMPKGFGEPGMVLCLKKNLYGRVSAPKTWFNFLRDNLKECGFEQMVEVDPCLFISDKVICLVYVDDTLLYAKDDQDIKDAIQSLRDRGMELEDEDDASGFLGVDIRRNPNTGEITLSQPGLIKKILEDLQIDDLPAVDVPATECLGKDPLGDPPQCAFNYATIIGKMQYVYGHSRPDIGFALSQCARFTFAPKRSHELALIRIGQYLKGTADKGMILKPIDLGEFKIDAYVDSDFLGIYGKESRLDPDNVRSRGGHIIMVNNCPIIWQSKLINAICLSTMMAEYYALSIAMREILPLRELLAVMIRGVKLDLPVQTTFKVKVWEDNMGCLTLANLDPGQTTPRSKFYDSKVHWFRSHLGPDLTVEKIESESQLADLFTKPLPKEAFVRLRKEMIGW